MTFYGVFLPQYRAGFEGNSTAHFAGSLGFKVYNCGDFEVPSDSPLWQIFTDKFRALNMLKRYRTGRLREFPSRQQAENYVKYGTSTIKPPKRIARAKLARKSVQIATPAGCDQSRNVSSSASRVLTSAASGGNSPNQSFRTPNRQEFIQFRKYIETGNYDDFKRAVWMNPRLLISSGDTPTILKDISRYNAMHVCAQLNQVRIAELILKVISDRKFTRLISGSRTNAEICATISGNLLDYYLNMPDKTRGETPLHIAAKNCHLAFVELLISYPQCKSLRNTSGLYPRDVIAQVQWNAIPKLIGKLRLLLSEPYYVPVLRACADELPPRIGEPFKPSEPPVLMGRNMETGHFVVKLRISALAGPMTREQAQSFYRRWKTPPRCKITAQLYESAGEPFPPHKELSDLNLNASSFRERDIKNSDIEKGLEVIGRQLAHLEQVEWREYWDFLDGFMDISSSSGLAHLETYLTAKSTESQILLLAEKLNQGMNLNKVEKYFDAVADRIKANIATAASKKEGAPPKRKQTAFMCVEKSLQVFARRITKTFLRHLDSLQQVNLKLHIELNRLNYLVLSFKDDARFIAIDFSKVHARIAELVAGNVVYSQDVGVVRRCKLMIMLRKLSQLNADGGCKHLHCMTDLLFLLLEQAPTVPLPDALQTEQLCCAAWQLAQGCNCSWETNIGSRLEGRRHQHRDTPRVEPQLEGEQPAPSIVPDSQSSSSKLNNVAVVSPVPVTVSEPEDDLQFYECYENVCSEMEETTQEGDDNSDDEDEVYFTPAHSRDSMFSSEMESCNVLFICGKKPTKRDDDVRLALRHVNVDKESFPCVHAWLQAVRAHSSVEEKLFMPPKMQHTEERTIYLQPKNRSTVAIPLTTSTTTPSPQQSNSQTTALVPWSAAAVSMSQSLYRKLNHLGVLLKNRKTEKELVTE